MARKKTSRLNVLIIGILLGATSQHIPEIRKYTQTLGIHLIQNIERYLTVDQVQDIILKRWKR